MVELNSQQKHINVGVIGLGVGEAHLKSYQSVHNCEVKSVCDIDPNRLEEIGNLYHIPNRYEDYRKITEDPNIDVVSICSYDNFHAEQLISALRNGKHVMVEKPFVLYRSEAEQVLRVLEESKRFITSNLILRQSPRFKEVKQMAQAGDFGGIYHIEGDYLHQILWKITQGWRGKMDFYSTVYGGGIHLIDLMRWIMDEEVIEVCAMGTDVTVRDTNYPREEAITGLLKWTSGASGKCTTTLAPARTKFHSLRVYGTDKTFVNGLPNAQIFTGDNPETDVSEMDVPYPAFEKGDLLPEFIQSIRNNEKPLINEVDIFRVMDVCFTIQESLEKKKTLPVSYLL